jgi:hypothetical protein
LVEEFAYPTIVGRLRYLKKETQEMTEEPVQSFPLPNVYELVHIYIKSELENAGIELQRISIDGSVTTNKEVPEETKSRLREYAADKGIIVKFLTSDEASGVR